MSKAKDEGAMQAGQLYQALLALDSEAQCAAFFEDLCTYQELSEMARRLEVARLLREGLNYQQIGAATGVSTATISRVNRALRYGAGGYAQVLDRLAQPQANVDLLPGSGRRSGGAGRPPISQEAQDDKQSRG